MRVVLRVVRPGGLGCVRGMRQSGPNRQHHPGCNETYTSLRAEPELNMCRRSKLAYTQ